ncbi:hypothetical protein SD10_20765 [Spirosoma radiotolerans]|uniref:Caspase family p20 domain-containing protein n=1 Tax=Spirosoma radiotolerans TaxID=1379870 RepID=A0A0E3V9A2_9BACT|nr:hypothetical protein SD10_20765 [Spirosoma radiotolerans]
MLGLLTITCFLHLVNAQNPIERALQDAKNYTQGASTVIKDLKELGGMLPIGKRKKEARQQQGQTGQSQTSGNNVNTRRSEVSVYDPEQNDRVISNTQARECFEKAQSEQDLTSQIKYLNDALKADNTLIEAYDLRGRALVELGKFDEAAKDFSRYIDFRPKDPEGYNNRGYAYLQGENYQQAIDDFGQSLANKSRTPHYVYNNRGWAFALSGEYQNGIDDLDAALKLNPTTPNALFRKGWCLQKAGNNQDALNVLDRVIAQDPNDINAWFTKGQANAALNYHKEAIICFSKILSLDKTNIDALFGRSLSHYALGKIGNAIEDCSAILQLGEDAATYNTRGYLLMQLVHPSYVEAIKDFDRSIALPNEASYLAYTNRGEALFKLEKYKEAQLNFNQAIALKADHQPARDWLDRVTRVLNPNTSSSTVKLIPNFLNRHALVMGNSTYRHSAPLSNNPLNDADDMEKLFKDLGFKVTARKDLDKQAMINVVNSFVKETQALRADVITVFYAGHGIEVDGVNYLVPVDARLIEQKDARNEGVSLDELLESLHKAKAAINLVFLDACRDNPFRNWEVGRTNDPSILARVTALGSPKNLHENVGVYYATGAKEVAGNGSGRNGSFTYGIKQNLRRNISLDDFWRNTIHTVREQTHNKQSPFQYGSIDEQLIF